MEEDKEEPSVYNRNLGRRWTDQLDDQFFDRDIIDTDRLEEHGGNRSTDNE